MEEQVESVMQYVDSPNPGKRNHVVEVVIALTILAVLAAISTPNLLRSRKAVMQSSTYYPGSRDLARGEGAGALEPAQKAGAPDFRKVIQTATIDVTVEDPGQALERVRAIAAESGGYIERSELTGWDTGSRSAAVVLRVPAARLDAVRQSIHALGGRVTSEHVQATDVTTQYVDLDAALRNYRAEEESYRAIMQRAGSIKDTLAVAQQLADVRGRIERAQAELNLLAKQAEMATITLNLRPELPVGSVSARVFSWHPVQVAKNAFLDGMEDLAGYADAMIAILFRLPAILLWLATLAVGAAASWRALRWTWRRLFATSSAQAAA
jgi:uncharacterized protein DUF4349